MSVIEGTSARHVLQFVFLLVCQISVLVVYINLWWAFNLTHLPPIRIFPAFSIAANIQCYMPSILQSLIAYFIGRNWSATCWKSGLECIKYSIFLNFFQWRRANTVSVWLPLPHGKPFMTLPPHIHTSLQQRYSIPYWKGWFLKYYFRSESLTPLQLLFPMCSMLIASHT